MSRMSRTESPFFDVSGPEPGLIAGISATRVRRKLVRWMSMLRVVLLALVCAGMAVAGSVDSLITFDSAPTTQSFANQTNVWAPLPSDYFGFVWTGWEVMNGTAYAEIYNDSTQPPYYPMGVNFAYPSTTSPLLAVTSGAPFDFLSAFIGAWPDTSDSDAGSVQIVGFLDGNVVGAVTENIYPTVWTYFPGFQNPVDALVFSPTGAYFKLDDIDVVENVDPSGNPTPEPFDGGLIRWGRGSSWTLPASCGQA